MYELPKPEVVIDLIANGATDEQIVEAIRARDVAAAERMRRGAMNAASHFHEVGTGPDRNCVERIEGIDVQRVLDPEWNG